MTTYILGPTDAFIHKCLDTGRGNAFAGWTPYVGFLATGMTASDGTGAVETTGTGYARQSAPFSAPGSRQMVNSAIINFGSIGPLDSGAPIRFFGLWTASTGGILYWVDAVTPPFQVPSPSTPVSIAAGILVLRGSTRTLVSTP